MGRRAAVEVAGATSARSADTGVGGAVAVARIDANLFALAFTQIEFGAPQPSRDATPKAGSVRTSDRRMKTSDRRMKTSRLCILGFSPRAVPIRDTAWGT